MPVKLYTGIFFLPRNRCQKLFWASLGSDPGCAGVYRFKSALPDPHNKHPRGGFLRDMCALSCSVSVRPGGVAPKSVFTAGRRVKYFLGARGLI